MTAIPPEAVTAAGNAMRSYWLDSCPQLKGSLGDPMDWAAVAVEAAAPLIAAAERDRIRRLAVESQARYWAHEGGQQGTYHPFADLLGGPS